METYNRSIRRRNKPELAPYKCLVIFTDPADILIKRPTQEQIEIFALCNWIPAEEFNKPAVGVNL